LNWHITYEKGRGKRKGDDVGTKSIDFEDSKVLWQQFSSPLPGEYKVEATLSDDTGKKIDSKVGTVTIKGSAVTPAADDKKKDSDDEDK